MNPLIDHLLHGGELGTLAILLFVGFKFINRIDSVLKDYPPHRHINGKILYPRDFSPAASENLSSMP